MRFQTSQVKWAGVDKYRNRGRTPLFHTVRPQVQRSLVMMVRRESRSRIVIAILSVILVSCASGPPFRAIESVPENRAVIYVYRQSSLRGAAFTPSVTVGNNAAVPLKNGGYLTMLVEPGNVPVTIRNVGQKTLSVEVVAGKSYYFRGGTVPMASGFPALTVVPEDRALSEIKECKLLSAQ
jgi:hypothetical protein